MGWLQRDLKMIRCKRLFASITLAALVAACSTERSEPETILVLAGQALIKKDPRLRWDDPYGSLRPILKRADVAFTNFEMAVLAEADRCGIPTDYAVSLGAPRLAPEDRPENSGGPHAIALIAATTSHDERGVIRHAVNGVWTGGRSLE